MNYFRISVFCKLLAVVVAATVFNSCEDKPVKSDGLSRTKPSVVINGVKWATRNVAAYRTFAENIESPGMLYQWNRKATDWIDVSAGGNVWAKTNDPSPDGWRLPTEKEFGKLLDTKMVRRKFTTINHVDGWQFTDKKTGNAVFFPVAGGRNIFGEFNSEFFAYWSSQGTSYDSYYGQAYCLYGNYSFVSTYEYSRKSAFSIRCVAE